MKYLLFIACCLSLLLVKAVEPVSSQKANIISFTENKGQIADQYYKSRPDVLFAGSDGALSFFIKNTGLSYQLRKVNKFTEVVDEQTKQKRKEIAQQTFYRIDISWLNANTDLTIKTGKALPGYNNYYLSQCVNGALNVKSYNDITVQNIYNGINLHYYNYNGHLKYDYIVAPHANYKQIQLQVKGALIKRKTDGGIILRTALGDVEEGRPVVYQNGKQLKAKWNIQNNAILSFEIENYNADKELIIDPLTRSWGTYYGGSEGNTGCSTIADASGNVYLAGGTENSGSGIIVTSGAHQTIFGGFVGDAFLVKFNAAGVRQWGTYYGGSSNETINSISTDATGNVYVAGSTNSFNGTSTIGSHQQSFNGSTDAFLVKFNSAGLRQWATYYGGPQSDSGQSCATDASGNIYMAGFTNSAGTVEIATPGSHQTLFSGNQDAFLVKFNSSGVRQWGTYYGGNDDDRGFSCATDAFGHVYLAGYAVSTTSIGTAAAHQPAMFGTGTQLDAFLVQFNSAGVRQWGTYYGDLSGDEGKCCATDALGNVYLTGYTYNSFTVVAGAISTPGAHQVATNGSADAFLVKFNIAGVRQWGTFYGGSNYEQGYSCSVDAAGNVYMCGEANTNSSFGLASSGCYQFTPGGHFLVKFNSLGVRQWGTFYGSTIFSGFGLACATDPSGNIYMAGTTGATTNSLIATANGHQPAFGGNNDAYLVKFRDCLIDPIVTVNNPICAGANLNFSTTISSNTPAVTYNWAGPNSFTSSAQSPLVVNAQPANAGTYTLTVNDSAGCDQTAIVTITVNANPTVIVNSGTICSGNSFTMVPSGAVNYTYSNGNATVSPTLSTNYTVTGADATGCSDTAVSNVIVNTTPTVSVNSGTICSGNAFTINPSGANNYTIQGGSTNVTPMANTNYTVVGSSAQNCISVNTATSFVTVNASPTVNAVSSNTNLICAGSSVSLTATGATSYTWNTNATSSIIAVSPTVTTTYSVTGTNANNCSNMVIITQSVSACTGLQNNYNDFNLSVYPNPFNNKFFVYIDGNMADKEIGLFNLEGKLLKAFKLIAPITEIDLMEYANGLFIIQIKEKELILKTLKIIKAQ
ncbi:MAG: SBBP repeat-containing protein [Bacteroidetes bacterium]|nr:SBBP repeat-containing protein [Bacteroidota bacterium]